MEAIKRNEENLISVAKSICKVFENCSCNTIFESDFKVFENCIVLNSVGRDSIDCSIIELIPCNYKWRVSFYSKRNILKLFIWF